MAQFSPALQAQLTAVPVNFAKSLKAKPTPGTATRFTGTLPQFFAFAREAMADGSTAGHRLGQWIKQDLAPTDSWAGFKTQSVADFLEQGYSKDALAAFDKALAKLNIKGVPSRPEYRVTGGVWSVPRYLTGHPLAAIHRPRVALPAKNWEFAIRYSGSADAATAAQPLAKIARAAWDYIKQGGPLTITVYLAGGYERTDQATGAQGFQVALRVNPSDLACLATCFSVNLRRSLGLAFGKATSPVDDDGLPMYVLHRPGMAIITGEPEHDNKALAALGIR